MTEPRDGIDTQRAVTVAVIVVAVAFFAWLLFLRGDDEEDATTAAARGPDAVTEEELRVIRSDVGHPIYWAGPDPDATYELVITDAGNVYIRYLTEDAEVGAESGEFLTVGTYPLENAYGALEVVAGNEGAIVRQNEDGSMAVTNEATPNNVYVAFPGSNYQIEVYDPDPDRALELATEGEIRPVE